MAEPITLVKPALITFDMGDGPVELTEHNRSPLAVSIERIETKQRTANGTLRKHHIADKHSFEVSWEMLPTGDTHTVDGRTGAATIWAMYNTYQDEFTMTVVRRNGTFDTYEVHFSSGEKSIEKRWGYEYWNVSLGMEEI